MKKILFLLFLLISLSRTKATELHVADVIVNFPCLVTLPDTISSTTALYKCSSDKVDFELHIIKDSTIKTYEDFIKDFTKKSKATILVNENKTWDHKTIKYLEASFTKDGAAFISESYLYSSEEGMFFMTAIRHKDNARRTETQIFLNSLIVIHP